MLLADQFVFGRQPGIRGEAISGLLAGGLSVRRSKISVKGRYRVILKRYPREGELADRFDIGGRIYGDEDLDYQLFECGIRKNQLRGSRAADDPGVSCPHRH